MASLRKNKFSDSKRLYLPFQELTPEVTVPLAEIICSRTQRCSICYSGISPSQSRFFSSSLSGGDGIFHETKVLQLKAVPPPLKGGGGGGGGGTAPSLLSTHEVEGAWSFTGIGNAESPVQGRKVRQGDTKSIPASTTPPPEVTKVKWQIYSLTRSRGYSAKMFSPPTPHPPPPPTP